MIRSILLFLFAFCITSAKSDIDEARLSYRNLLKNPGAENGKSGVAVSNTANLAIETTAAEVARGSASFHWTPTAASETILFGVASPDGEVEKGQCLASGVIKPDANYSTGLIVARVENSGSPLTDDLDLGPLTSGEWKPFQIAFICPDTGSIDLEFEVTGASGFKIDSLWLGKDYRIGESSPIITEWQSFTPTINNLTSSTSSWFKRRVGSSLEVRGGVTITSVTGSISLVIPDSLNIANGVDTRSTLGDVTATNTGTNFKIGNVVQQTSTTVIFLNDDATQFFNATVPFTWASGDMLYTNFTVEIAEWQNQGVSKTVTLETQGWLINATIREDVNNGLILGLANDASVWNVPEQDDLYLTLDAKSAPAQIGCSGSNPPTGLTCSSGNEQISASFSVPYAGVYYACMEFTYFTRGAASTAAWSQYFKLRETGLTNQTIVDETVSIGGGFTANSSGTNLSYGEKAHVCATFNWTAGQKMIRLFETTNINSGTINLNRMELTGTPLNAGLKLTVIPLTQNFPQAVAIANVETGATADCTTGNICSGVYTPTFTPVQNVVSITQSPVPYTRVGNVVTMALRGNIDVTTGGTDVITQFRVSLPIPSDFTSSSDGSGSAAIYRSTSGGSVSNSPIVCTSEVGSDTCDCQYHHQASGGGAIVFPMAGTFTYLIK